MRGLNTMLPQLIPAGLPFYYVTRPVHSHLPRPLPQPPRMLPIHCIYSLSHTFTDSQIHQHQIANKIGRTRAF
jgi:hypothetical protein